LIALLKFSGYRKNMILSMIVILAISSLFAGRNAFGANPAVGDQNWAMFGHDLSHTGSSPSTGPSTNNTLWSYPMTYTVYSSPAVVDGKIYISLLAGAVYCFDAATGARIWNYTTDGMIYSTPTVVNGKVYIGLEDGIGSQTGAVYCLDAATGTRIWNYTSGAIFASAAAVVDDKLYIGGLDGVYCLDATIGTLAWKYNGGFGSFMTSVPAVVDGKVYIGSAGRIYCFDAAKGAIIWTSSDSGTWYSPAVVDGKVYAGSASGGVYCFDASTGNRTWNYTASEGYFGSSPAVVNGKVYIGSENPFSLTAGALYCLDATTGTFVWKYTTGTPPYYSSPAVADGKVYMGSGAFIGKLYCIDALTGVSLWNFTKSSLYYVSSPAVADGKVYMSSDNVYCFGLSVSSPTSTPKATTSITPTTSSTNPTPSNSSKTSVPSLFLWVPPPPEYAAAATVISAIILGIAAVMASLAGTQVGTRASKATLKIRELFNSSVKRWLEDFVNSKRKLAVSQKASSRFIPTKSEAIIYVISIAVLTLSFAYVRVNNLIDLLQVIPMILATSVFVKLAKSFILIVFSRTRGVWTELKFWYLGVAIFLFSTLAFRIPFSSPTRYVHHTSNYTKRLGATLSGISISIDLGFAAVFGFLFLGGLTLIGSTGIAMCLISAFLDSYPLSPMSGKDIFDHNKLLWLAFFVTTLSLYCIWLILF